MHRKHRLCSEVTLDQIHDYFTVGKPVHVETIPKSKLGGLPLDPNTGEAAIPQHRHFVPNFRRLARNDVEQIAYAEEAKKKEEEMLKYQTYGRQHQGNGTGPRGAPPSIAGDSIISSSVSMLEKLADTVSMFTDHTLTASIQLPEGMTEEKAVEVYQQYDFHHAYNHDLPIVKHRENIVGMIESNQVTVIEGETGSGKTTQVPQFILDHYIERNQYCNIIVTQPRRIAAISIARRVCSERNWQLGGICGYQVGLERRVGQDIRLLYCTTGVLLEKLIAAKNMHQYTHVILDEVHERDKDTDFCLLVVRKYLRSHSKDTKIVLMSATFDTDQFAVYFAQPVGGILEKAPVLTIEGRKFEVSEFYLEDLRELGHLPAIQVGTPTLSHDAIKLATTLIKQLDQLETGQQNNTTDIPNRGSVLVFLPGIEEIAEMEASLDTILISQKLWIRPLHSTITGEEQIKVFDHPPPGHRKVILSTNIAESSITVSDIKYVIDFCLTKQLISDPDTNFSCLQLLWASKANCTQRKGRAGRVSNGRVYRFVTHRFWKEHLEEFGTPEMKRCPIESLILKVKLLDIGEPKAILGLALTPPIVDDIEKTIMLLKEIGALSLQSTDINPYDGELTFLGKVVGKLPLDVHLGKLILFGHVFGVLDEAIIISASLSLKTFFFQPHKATMQSFKYKLAWADGTFSDCLAYCSAFMAWKNRRFDSGSYSLRTETEWCHQNYIQMRRIRDVNNLVNEIHERLKVFKIFSPRQILNVDDPDRQLLIKLVLCGAFYPNYFLQSTTDEEMAEREMSGHNPLTTVMVRGLPVNQGTLYRRELEDIFKQCDGRRPRIYFEDTKAFIEFLRDPRQKPNDAALTAVYMALKLRMNRNQLQLPYIDAEDIQKRLQKMSFKMTMTHSDEGDTDRRSDFSSDVNSYHPSPFLYPATAPKIVEVIKSEIVCCGHLWANLVKDGAVRYDLHQQIQQFARMPVNFIPEFDAGDYCLAPFQDTETVEYYRARIDQKNQHKAMVFFIDYGNYEEVDYNCLRPIDPQLLQWRVQAVECVLAHIKPSLVKCPDSKWTTEANERFKYFIESAETILLHVFSVVHGVMRVVLHVRLMGNHVINVNDELTKLSYAEHDEESYLSVQNHQLRETSIGKALVNLEDPISSFSSAPYKPDLHTLCRMREQEKLMKQSTAPERSRGMVFLNGPWNSCEIGFGSLMYAGRLKTTRVERDSVNSVTLNTRPQDSSQSMMVASYIGLQQNSKSIIARDTTLMPAIPGLHALMALVFCPTAELRTDVERRCYTGALCGLGCDPDSEEGDPIFPDRDMEIAFNMHFVREDLAMVNGIRLAINLAIGNNENDWGEEGILKIQRSARTKLLDLVRRRRQTKQPAQFTRNYRWKQIEPRYILDPNVETVEGKDITLLNLHRAIQLNNEDDDKEAEEMTLQNKLLHQQYLETKAHLRSAEQEEILCQFCNMLLHSASEVNIHLSSSIHLDRQP